jgi:hypothetical protein
MKIDPFIEVPNGRLPGTCPTMASYPAIASCIAQSKRNHTAIPPQGSTLGPPRKLASHEHPTHHHHNTATTART